VRGRCRGRFQKITPTKWALEPGALAASKNLNRQQRRQRAGIASYESWARTTDRTARTQRGRDAFHRGFHDKVASEHPDLDPEAQAKMAEAAYKAHFAKMTFERSKRRTKAQEMTNAGNGTRRSSKTGDVTSDGSSG
jgi:hypothetical protein